MKKQIISLFLVLSVLFMFSCKKDKENTKCSEENFNRAFNSWTQASQNFNANMNEKTCEAFKAASVKYFEVAKNCSKDFGQEIPQEYLDEIRKWDCSDFEGE